MDYFDKFNSKKLIKDLIYAFFFASLIRTFLYEPFVIPSGSMLPNFLVGDRLIVEKFTYGYNKYSFPLNAFPVTQKFLVKDMPDYGESVVFRMPEHNNEHYIKRVIGKSGDVIEMKNGIVFINKKPNKQKFIQEAPMEIMNMSIKAYLYLEEDQNGKKYYIYRLSKKGNMPEDNMAPIRIPEGHYFMMGDNRNNSKDSRFAYMGFVPFEQIVGKAKIVFFSSDGDFYEIWKWKSDMKFNRIGKIVDKI